MVDAHFLERCFVVDQTSERCNIHHGLQHPVAREVLAIVDRSANVAAAAKAIVSSRCSFQGTSPYAVDVVLVNEWVRDELLGEFEREIMALSGNNIDNYVKSEAPWSAKVSNKGAHASVKEKFETVSHELLEFEFPIRLDAFHVVSG